VVWFPEVVCLLVCFVSEGVVFVGEEEFGFVREREIERAILVAD
jgi:hypothetical protein